MDNQKIGMNEEKGLRKIKTTVEFPGEQVIEEDSSDDQSVVSPLPTGVGGCMKPPDPSRSPTKRSISSQKHIGIEMRMANAGQQDCGYIEVSPSEPGADFLTGPAPLITRTDFMHMIQEGVRMALSAKARNNDVTVIKTRTSAPIIGNESVNSQQSNQVEGKKKSMRYILHQYKPKNFQQIRTIHGITNEDFISSLCDSDLLGGWTESSGKSGSLFWYSSDRRYIMKSISAQETHVMNHMCSSYLRYIGSHPHSLLCKFFGMFKITTYVAAPSVIRGGQRASRIRSNVVQVTRFVIMNNVFEALDTPVLHRPVAQSSTDPSPPVIEKFDLKGTTEDRYVRPISGKEVLKDINFNNRWITLPQHLAECLIEVITEDCQFLHHHGIMDYSLILGIKESNNPETRARLFASNIDLVGSLHSSHHESKPTFKKKFESKMKEMSSAVHKLLTPNSSKSLDVLVPPKESSSLPSRMPSITEENFKPVVTDSASEPPKGSITPIATKTANDRSIFTSFHGGVAGLSEPRTGTVIYYLGIIDILQEYTIKKKAAHCIKRFSIGCCHEIDTVAPLRYKDRFHKYMVSKIQTGHDIVES
jgi:1-phosphatidylinositol-4-phosphate 5-kinase